MGAIKTMGIVKYLIEIWPNKVCDKGSKELMVLWVNKDLAKKNFIKYAEQYRTLVRIINYSDKVHINKMKKVISNKLQTVLIIYEITN